MAGAPVKRALPLFMLFLLAPEAFANEFAARDTAQVPRVGGWSAGVLHPLRWVPLPNVEFRLHPLVFALAPHASARVSHVRSGAWTLSGDYGLAVPYLAAKALQGHLFPAYERGGGDVGFSLLPSLGALLSHHSAERVITAKLDVAFRLPIVASDLRPLEAPAPIEMLFAPWLNDYRLRAGGLWDSRVSPRLRARCYVDVFVHGVDADRDALVLDHFTFRTGAGLDVAVSSRWRLAVGVVVWNAQQFAKDDHGRPKRSTDVLPVLDAIWALP